MQSEARIKFLTKVYKNTPQEKILCAMKECANPASKIEKALCRGIELLLRATGGIDPRINLGGCPQSCAKARENMRLPCQ